MTIKTKYCIGDIIHVIDFDMDDKVYVANSYIVNDIVVKLEFQEDLKDLPFSEFIKKIEPSNFKIEDYDFVLNESVEMLTYKK